MRRGIWWGRSRDKNQEANAQKITEDERNNKVKLGREIESNEGARSTLHWGLGRSSLRRECWNRGKRGQATGPAHVQMSRGENDLGEREEGQCAGQQKRVAAGPRSQRTLQPRKRVWSYACPTHCTLFTKHQTSWEKKIWSIHYVPSPGWDSWDREILKSNNSLRCQCCLNDLCPSWIPSWRVVMETNILGQNNKHSFHSQKAKLDRNVTKT